MAMEILNQVGHLQHWGISPAINFLSTYQNKQATDFTLRVLLSGTSDIRHILKTLTDISIQNKINPKKIQIYFHEINKQLICRALLFLHIIHETHLNFQERVQLFLDLYGNALIKERNSRYLDHFRIDLLNFIHSQKKKIYTPLNKFVSLKMLKFQERDQLSQFVQSWSNKVEFDIENLRDKRLRFLFKQRYDHRANLTDWDYNMSLSQYAPIIHFYHYKQWRMEGLAFQQRFSTYTQPNRTLASYIPGRKKLQRTSCLVRGYWGDIMISPYIAMGTNTNSQQKQLLFKKANLKYIGHAVQLTQYNLRYWLTRIQTGQTYHKQFRDYYRTDQQGKKKLQQIDTKKKSKKNPKKQAGLKAIEEDKKQQQQIQQNQQQQTKQQKQQQQQIKKQQIPSNIPKKQQRQQDLDSQEQQRRKQVEIKNKSDITQEKQSQVLLLFKKYNIQFLPICTPVDNLVTKSKFKQFFDVCVLGFFHTAYLNKGLQVLIKDKGNLYVEKSKYLVPKRKQQRKQLDEKLKQISFNNSFKLTQDADDYLVFKKFGLRKQQ